MSQIAPLQNLLLFLVFSVIDSDDVERGSDSCLRLHTV